LASCICAAKSDISRRASRYLAVTEDTRYVAATGAVDFEAFEALPGLEDFSNNNTQSLPLFTSLILLSLPLLHLLLQLAYFPLPLFQVRPPIVTILFQNLQTRLKNLDFSSTAVAFLFQFFHCLSKRKDRLVRTCQSNLQVSDVLGRMRLRVLEFGNFSFEVSQGFARGY